MIVVADATALILLAQEHVATFLSDDKAARREAQSQGLEVTGLLAVLLQAKARGAIPQVKRVLDELVGEGFRLAPDLYALTALPPNSPPSGRCPR